MKKFISFALLCVVLTVNFAYGQQAKISSGAKNLTYYTMVDQMIAMCGTDGSLTNVEQLGGSPGTITDIVNNKAAGGPVQFDVLWMRSRNQDLTTIKTLFPLHREQVHVVVLNKDVKQGGVMGFGGTTTVLQDVRSLKGLNVAAQGGSVYTAQAINQLSGLGFNINSEFTKGADVIDAVRSGKVHAAIFVGGAPMEFISKLSREFRLLPFDAQTIEKLKDVYRAKSVVYENLSTTGTATVEVDALFVVNDYKSAKMSAVLNKLRACVKSNIDDLREADGSHPAWRSVNLSSTERAKWELYVGKQ